MFNGKSNPTGTLGWLTKPWRPKLTRKTKHLTWSTQRTIQSSKTWIKSDIPKSWFGWAVEERPRSYIAHLKPILFSLSSEGENCWLPIWQWLQSLSISWFVGSDRRFGPLMGTKDSMALGSCTCRLCWTSTLLPITLFTLLHLLSSLQ